MQRFNTFRLYQLGQRIHPLTELKTEGQKYGDVFGNLLQARFDLADLLKNVAFSLKTCRQPAEKLIDSINEIIPPSIQEAVRKDKEIEIDWWQLSSIKDAANRFETVLSEELAILDTYTIAAKGAYSTPELISNAEVMFPPKIREKIPARAIEDIKQAGKCLAFETSTAAAFHIVRALESLIVEYFKKIAGTNPVDKRRNWGVYIKVLRTKPEADPKILDFLEHIKDNYRNPISHPEATLSTDEVTVLLGVAVGAITQICLAL
jgi:hypothetical protein